MFDGIITKCHSAGRPFVIGASTDVSICNILDFVDASDTGGKQVLFTFDGAASRIKFSNIKSPRTFLTFRIYKQMLLILASTGRVKHE